MTGTFSDSFLPFTCVLSLSFARGGCFGPVIVIHMWWSNQHLIAALHAPLAWYLFPLPIYSCLCLLLVWVCLLCFCDVWMYFEFSLSSILFCTISRILRWGINILYLDSEAGLGLRCWTFPVIPLSPLSRWMCAQGALHHFIPLALCSE